ncbi:MAG: hypothetical protein K2R98_19470 [Gemmataceae bacterium]|nr:hypothetical protein [Gemmataceae bacterium]
MALKGDRHIVQTEISFSLSDVAERGVVVMYSVAGSGHALADAAGTVTLLAANSSGNKPAGLLLNDFVSIDQTVTHRNWHKDVQVLGERATLLRKGWVVSNKITGTPTLGATAYVAASGLMTPSKHATGGEAMTPKCGEFMGIKDEDGYCKVAIELPAI